MAGENGKADDRAQDTHAPRECMPCRGTGQLISNLGGTTSTLSCPWCRGGGVRLSGIDAQAERREDPLGASPQGDST
jgi:DnaJ-class molecular chaperone